MTSQTETDTQQAREAEPRYHGRLK